MNNDRDNVTFSAFFKLAMIILPGILIYVTTLIPVYFGKNGLIFSLFLMLCIAFAYVILLYIVYTKIDERNRHSGEMSHQRIIALIFGMRMAVRMGIFMYALSETSRQLMLRRYSSVVICLPLFLGALYMGKCGFKGMLRFGEAVFWLVCVAGGIVLISSVSNMDLSELKACAELIDEGGISATISGVMSRGGLLFLGFIPMEMLVIMYLRIKNRSRGMLIGTTCLGTLVGVIGSIIVVCTLGVGAMLARNKNTLYVVGAMELPGGIKIRPLILVCYLLLVSGMMLITANVVSGFGAMDRLGESGRKWRWRALWIVVVCAVFLWITHVPSTRSRVRLVMVYLALVDIPLSLILPAVSVVNRWKTGKVMLMWMAMLWAGVLNGCSYKAVEDVDYVNAVIVEEDSGSNYKYSLVITELNDDKDALTKENIYSARASSFAEVCDAYNAGHTRSLDTSHVEYVVADNVRIMDAVCPELEKEFATSYVTVVIDSDILEKSKGNNTKDYLKTHCRGECLATFRRDAAGKNKSGY